MAFPKKKRRTLIVEDKTYFWICTQSIHCEYPRGPEGERPDENGILPPLDPKYEWFGYEEEYGYSSIANLLIESENGESKAKVVFKGADYYYNVLDPREVCFIHITPGIVKKCIEFLNTEKKWHNNFKTVSIYNHKFWWNEIRQDQKTSS
ncbi:MAG: hypothetical protein MI810_25170 [Flavobacteriales bacterium]|nr:hypothetical protein [Flavobacteriales bacterium]